MKFTTKMLTSLMVLLFIVTRVSAQTCAAGVYDCAYVDIPADETCAAHDDTYVNPAEYGGILVVAAIFAACMAFGIGSNDAANSWATPVGSGAISLQNAVILGGICEWIGAISVGYGVSGSISKGVTDIKTSGCWSCGFCDSMMTPYMCGMSSALFGAALFLLIASRFGVPVSTTHAIVGGVVGATMVGAGPSCLNWAVSKGLGGIMLSWVISPVFSGLVAVFFFALSDCFILKSDNPYERSLFVLPMNYCISSWCIVFLILMKSKGIKKMFSLEVKLIISTVFAAVVLIIVKIFIVDRTLVPTLEIHDAEQGGEEIKDAVEQSSEEQKDNQASVSKDSNPQENDKRYAYTQDVAKKVPNSVDESMEVEALGSKTTISEIDMKRNDNMSVAETIVRLEEMGYNYEQAKAVYAFRYLLVLNAALEAFSHGGNDTANATGAFTAVWQTYQNGYSNCDRPDSPVWIMAAAGFFLFLGIYLYGENVIRTIGTELILVDFHRAYYIELGSVVAVIVATVLGFPVSTTHCQVGALVFVGMYDLGTQEVSWPLFNKVVLSWIITLPFAGSAAALLTWIFMVSLK